MSNKAKNSKESIICDAKELMKIYDTLTWRLPKARREHGAVKRFEDAGYRIIHYCTIAMEMRRRLAQKGVRLNERKFYDQPAVHGCEFLGSHIRPNRIHLNNNTYDNALRAIDEMNERVYKDIGKMESVFNSYGGLLKNRTDHGRLIAMRDQLSTEWWQWFDWNEKRRCVAFKPEYSVNERLNKKYHLKLKKNEQTRNSGADQPAQHRENGVRVAA